MAPTRHQLHGTDQAPVVPAPTKQKKKTREATTQLVGAEQTYVSERVKMAGTNLYLGRDEIGRPVELPSGAKILVRPDQYHSVVTAIEDMDLKPRHLITEFKIT